MNKKLLFCIICLVSYASAQAFTHRLDSIVTYDNDQWSKNTFGYNDDLSVAAYTTFTKVDGKWVQQQHTAFMRDAAGNDTAIVVSTAGNTLKHIYNYDTQGRIVNITTYKIVGTAAIDSAKTDYAYNSTGNIKQEEQYIMINGTWTRTIKHEYTYNTNGLVSEQLNYSSNQNENAWKYQTRSLYEYDTELNLIKEIYQYYFINAWFDSFTLSYTYNEDSQLQSVTKTILNDFEEVWKLTDSITYTYTTVGDLAQTRYYQYSDGWYEAGNDTYTYTTTATDQCAGYSFAQTLYDDTPHSYTLTQVAAYSGSTLQYRCTYHYTAFAPTDIAQTHNDTPLIYAHDGRIVASEPLRIYTLTGIDVTALNGSLKGVYIVKTATKTLKMFVK